MKTATITALALLGLCVAAAGSYHELCKVFHDPLLDPERLDVIAAFEHVAGISSLGDLPLTVITADTRTSPGLAATELTRLNQVWDEGVDTWAALSARSTVVIVIDTGHNIQLEHPDVVIREVSTLLARCTEGEKQPCTS